MNADIQLNLLSNDGIELFKSLQTAAAQTVAERFYHVHGAHYERFGTKGHEACYEDLMFHLEFLRPALEFGLIQPMIDYLCWLNSVLSSRDIPSEHLSLSLDWLGEFFAAHMTPDDARIVVDALTAAKAGFEKTADRTLQPRASKAPWPEVSEFVKALLAGGFAAAQGILDRCLAEGKHLIDIEIHVIQPALYEIGEKWQKNEVSVAQEHLATAMTQSLMAVALQKMHPLPSVNKRVLLACVEGNNHAVGLQMVADAFLLSGWEVQYLGANVPTKSLIEQAATWHPDLIGLSVSFPQQLRIVKSVIAQLNEHFGARRPAVMVGGLAFNRFQELAELTGADSCCLDAKTAVEFADKISKP